MSFFPKLILIKIRIWFLKLDSSISKFTLKVKTNQQNSEKEEQWWWGRGWGRNESGDTIYRHIF